MLRKDPCKRRRHVIAQRQPVALVRLVRFLPGEHALIGTVHIRKKLAQRLDRFNCAGFKGIETIEMIHLGDLAQHLAALSDLGTKVISEPLRRLRLWARLFLDLGHVDVLQGSIRGAVYPKPPTGASSPATGRPAVVRARDGRSRAQRPPLGPG